MDNFCDQLIPEKSLDTVASLMNLTNGTLGIAIAQESLELCRTHGQVFPVEVVQGCCEPFGSCQYTVHSLLVDSANVFQFLHNEDEKSVFVKVCPRTIKRGEVGSERWILKTYSDQATKELA